MFCRDPGDEEKLFWCGVSLRNRFVCHTWVIVREDGTNMQYYTYSVRVDISECAFNKKITIALRTL
jgi:hypothetical protein